MTTIQFYSPIQGHLDYLQFSFSIINNFAMNIPVHENFGTRSRVPQDGTRRKMAFQYNAWLLASAQDDGLSCSVIYFFNKFILSIYFWLRWVFVAVRRLSLVAVSGGYSSLWCMGFSLRWLLLLWSTGSRAQASVVVARGLSSCGSQALECRLSSCGARA